MTSKQGLNGVAKQNSCKRFLRFSFCKHHPFCQRIGLWNKMGGKQTGSQKSINNLKYQLFSLPVLKYWILVNQSDNNEAILKQYSWSNFNLRRDMLKYFPHVTLAVVYC